MLSFEIGYISGRNREFWDFKYLFMVHIMPVQRDTFLTFTQVILV